MVINVRTKVKILLKLKKLSLFLIFFIFGYLSYSQVKISGVVLDVKLKPLPGVNVYLKDTYDGATTDDLGKFEFETIEVGQQNLVASYLGFENYEKGIELASSVKDLKIILKEKINELSLVTITASSFEASDERKVTVLKPLDIVTTAGAQGDLVSALKTLPGAQQIGEQEGLFVRGGTGAETQTFIDGLLVDRPFFSSTPDIAQRGRFSPFLFKGTIFSTGGYSSLYGQGLSGALILESLDIPERSASTLALSTIGVGAGIFKLYNDNKACVGGDINYTDLSPYFSLVSQKQSILSPPRFAGGTFFWRQRIKKTGIIKFYSYYNYGQLKYGFENIDIPTENQLFGLKNGNLYTNLTYKTSLANDWVLNSGISVSDNIDKIEFGGLKGDSVIYSTGIKNTSGLYQARAVFSKLLGQFSTFRIGAEHQIRRGNTNFSVFNFKTDDQYSAVFAESDLYYTSALALRLGLRGEYSSLIDKINLAPRISVAYKISPKTTANIAYGNFFQQPSLEYTYSLQDRDYSKASHYIANVQTVTKDYTFRTELFYKKYSQLIKTVPDTTLSGNGYAQGIEVFWRDRKTLKNVDYWISYSYLNTKRNWLNFPIEAQPSFAANHTANFVFKKFFTKIKTNISATYSYATGRPYFNPNRPEQEFLSDRTPDYHSLGISASYLTTVGKAFTVLVFSVTNAVGNNQVFGYRYSSDGTRRAEVNPPAPRFFFVGMFMSWGIDRRQEVIDNN